MAVDPLTNQVFVTSRSQNKVYYLDGDTLDLAGSVDVGVLPFGLAANPTDRLLYVANYGSGSVSLISMDVHQVLATYLTGGGPTFVAVDPATGDAFVPLHPTNQVAHFRNGSYLGNVTVRADQVFAVALDTGVGAEATVHWYARPRRRRACLQRRHQHANVHDHAARGRSVLNMGIDAATGLLYVTHALASDSSAQYVTVYDRRGAQAYCTAP